MWKDFLKGTTKAALFTTVFIVGVWSLVASMPPPSYVQATTLNNFGDRQYERPVYACREEVITLAWQGAGRLTLSADPAESFSPPLTERRVESSGTLEVTAQDRAEVLLDASEGYGDLLPVELVPETLCTGFDFPLVGWYQGTLTQTSPTDKRLTRQLALYILESGVEETTLYIDISDDANDGTQRFTPCVLDATAAQLDCASESGDGSTFEVSAQITERGLSGSYSGVTVDAGAAIPFSGTLSFDKQPGIPPSPPEEEL